MLALIPLVLKFWKVGVGIAAVLAVLFLIAQAHHKGVAEERGRWEAKVAQEVQRRVAIQQAAAENANRRAEDAEAHNAELDGKIKDVLAQAAKAPKSAGRSDVCIPADVARGLRGLR